LKTKGLTPQHILDNWSKVMDFTNPDHPNGPPDMMKLLENAGSMPDNKPVSNEKLVKGRVALVTGGGSGLGRAYAKELAKYGAKVFVCDVKNAAAVAEEIVKAGGEAKSTDISAERGDEVVKAVLEAYGRIELIVNNAGILRDKSFTNISETEWKQVRSNQPSRNDYCHGLEAKSSPSRSSIAI
jgi:multifunctional beta-oxidation protein